MKNDPTPWIEVSEGPEPYPVHIRFAGEWPTLYCISTEDAIRLRDQLDTAIKDITTRRADQ
jgi:hypothetical protein